MSEQAGLEARLYAAEEWARTMEHERDYEQQVVSEDLRRRLAESEAVRRQLAEAVLRCHAPNREVQAMKVAALAASDALDSERTP